MNIKKLSSLLDNDQKLVDKFLEVFKTETPKQLNNLYEAMEKADWATVSNIAHGLKSQARYLDLLEAASTAAYIEAGADQEDDLDSMPVYLYELEQNLMSVINEM